MSELARLRHRHNDLVDELIRWREEYEAAEPGERAELEDVIAETTAAVAEAEQTYWKEYERGR